jgi:hypothetical protein
MKDWLDIVDGQGVDSVEELDALWQSQLDRMAASGLGPKASEWVELLKKGVAQLKEHGDHTLAFPLRGLLDPYQRCLEQLEGQGKFTRPRKTNTKARPARSHIARKL